MKSEFNCGNSKIEFNKINPITKAPILYIFENNPTLKIQLDMYEMKTNANGKRTYNAANGYHDDCIIAMLLALDCINKGTYAIRQEVFDFYISMNICM